MIIGIDERRNMVQGTGCDGCRNNQSINRSIDHWKSHSFDCSIANSAWPNVCCLRRFPNLSKNRISIGFWHISIWLTPLCPPGDAFRNPWYLCRSSFQVTKGILRSMSKCFPNAMSPRSIYETFWQSSKVQTPFNEPAEQVVEWTFCKCGENIFLQTWHESGRRTNAVKGGSSKAKDNRGWTTGDGQQGMEFLRLRSWWSIWSSPSWPNHMSIDRIKNVRMRTLFKFADSSRQWNIACVCA